MISLTRMNGTPLVLNSDLICSMVETPDTVLTMLNGPKLTVRESSYEVASLVLAQRRRVQAARGSEA